MATDYPARLDTFPSIAPTDPRDGPGVEHSIQHTDLGDAIEALQTALGLNPAGSALTVAARIADVEGDVTSLASTVSGHTSTLATHGTAISSAEGEIDDLQTDVADISASLATVTTDLDTAEAAITAITTELGGNPSGSSATVAARLDELAGALGFNITYGDTEPATPAVGDFWLDTSEDPGGSSGGTDPSFSNLGDAGSAVLIDINAADVQRITLNSTTCTIAFTGSVPTNRVRRWSLLVVHDATSSSRTIVWPGTVPTPPALLTTTPNAIALIDFMSLSDGTVLGNLVGNYT